MPCYEGAIPSCDGQTTRFSSIFLLMSHHESIIVIILIAILSLYISYRILFVARYFRYFRFTMRLLLTDIDNAVVGYVAVVLQLAGHG
jgi:hypothetical protein